MTTQPLRKETDGAEVKQFPEKIKKTPEHLAREAEAAVKKKFTEELKSMADNIKWISNTNGNVLIGTLGSIARVLFIGKENIITGLKTLFDMGYQKELSVDQSFEAFQGIFINRELQKAEERNRKNKKTEKIVKGAWEAS
ncbi:MAG: hypothetical protein Q7U36_01655 [bacterium]|nr:hypothetical protein [bacterium]